LRVCCNDDGNDYDRLASKLASMEAEAAAKGAKAAAKAAPAKKPSAPLSEANVGKQMEITSAAKKREAMRACKTVSAVDLRICVRCVCR
jgi:hypothetical protein